MRRMKLTFSTPSKDVGKWLELLTDYGAEDLDFSVIEDVKTYKRNSKRGLATEIAVAVMKRHGKKGATRSQLREALKAKGISPASADNVLYRKKKFIHRLKSGNYVLRSK